MCDLCPTEWGQPISVLGRPANGILLLPSLWFPHLFLQFGLDCRAGHVNSAMLPLIFLMLSSVVSASSNITACEQVFSRHSQLLVIYPLVSSLYHLDCV